MNWSAFSVPLFVAAALLSAAAAPPHLTKNGIEIDGGTMGRFTFGYPKFRSEGEAVAPQVALKENSATLSYLAKGAPRLELTLKNGRLTGKSASAAPGKLIWEMFLPIRFAGQGVWTLEPGGQSGRLPAEQPPRPHLVQQHGSKFRFADPQSGESISVTWGGDGFWQLQDNRQWGWKIFQLSLFTDVLEHRNAEFSLEFEEADASRVPARVDRFGQPVSFDFPGKIRDESELRSDVAADRLYYSSLTPPPAAPWGGMPGSRKEFGRKATGFFRLDQVEGRDVLITPEGDLFFQLGVCTVCPGDDHTYIKGRERIYEWLPPYESEYKSAYRGAWATDFSFYLANRIRKTGRPFELAGWKLEQIDRLRRWGFNSEGAFTTHTPELNRQKKFGRTPELARLPGLAGEIPDPFDEAVRRKMDKAYAPIAEFRDDPSIIGYFIANEQPYGDLLRKLPAFDSRTAAKQELVKQLRRQYGSIDRFNAAWNLQAGGFDALNDLPLPVRTRAAWEDMQNFARHFFDAYFSLVARTFRKYDPNHLLLGARFQPSDVAVTAAAEACAKYCDLFSINYYARAIEPEFLEKLHRLVRRPILLSEWSYGTAEQGLSGGVIDTRNQMERGRAYRSYLETAAALPFVVGSQWFSHLDQALTGRYFEHYNGESMNIGLLNVADRPYKEFLAEVMKSHRRIYALKLGRTAPFSERTAPERPLRKLQIPRALPGQRVDGVKEPWPGRPAERLDRSCLVLGAESGGTGADFRLCWDEQNLYLYVEVVDATPWRNHRRGPDLWQGDCLELFTGVERDGSGALRPGDRHLLISAGENGGSWFVNSPEQAAVTAVVLPHPGGYVLEAAVPWQALGIEPRSGLSFRFDLGLDDGDGTRRLRQFLWSGTARNSSERSGWGSAVLVE